MSLQLELLQCLFCMFLADTYTSTSHFQTCRRSYTVLSQASAYSHRFACAWCRLSPVLHSNWPATQIRLFMASSSPFHPFCSFKLFVQQPLSPICHIRTKAVCYVSISVFAPACVRTVRFSETNQQKIANPPETQVNAHKRRLWTAAASHPVRNPAVPIVWTLIGWEDRMQHDKWCLCACEWTDDSLGFQAF